MLAAFLQTALDYLREVAEVVVLGFLIAGVINAVVNKDAVARFLGGPPLVANLLGATIGIVTPLCCCSAIPTAMTLYRAGSRRGPACAFLIATPWFNWYGLTALIVFLGPRVALAVAGSAVLIAFAAGTLIDLFDTRAAALPRAPDVTPAAGDGRGCRAAGCGCTPLPSAIPGAAPLLDLSDPLGKVRAGVQFALDMLRELGAWILLGVLLGAATQTLVPERLFARYLGGVSIAGLLAALLVAGLFSADSLGTLPWVESLLGKGLGAGSAMILLVAGVGTNVSTLGPVARVMGRRTAFLYAAGVVVLAGLFGLALNLAL